MAMLVNYSKLLQQRQNRSPSSFWKLLCAGLHQGLREVVFLLVGAVSNSLLHVIADQVVCELGPCTESSSISRNPSQSLYKPALTERRVINSHRKLF